MNRLLDLLSRALDETDREVAVGDLAEREGTRAEALRDLIGLLARRQAELWKHPMAWLALFGLAVPLACLLHWLSAETAYGNAVTIWLYASNWDWNLLGDAAFRHDLGGYSVEVFLSLLTLACGAWAGGVVLAAFSGRHVIIAGAVFCLIPLVGVFLPHPYAPVHAAVFEVPFYRVIFHPLVVGALVLPPSLLGMRQGSRVSTAAALATLGLIAIANRIEWSVFRLLLCWPALYWIASARRHLKGTR